MHEATASRLARTLSLEPERLGELQEKKVGAIGGGALGGASLSHFAVLQIGLLIVDCGRVEPENLGNAGFEARSVGMWKSDARALQMHALNPDCSVRSLPARVEDLGLAQLGDCSLLLGGLDGTQARMRVNEISRSLGIPWIDGAVAADGRSLFGHVSLYDPRVPDAPCYLCSHDAASLSALLREERGPGCPSWRRPEASLTPPTLQSSAFAALVAAHQSLWGIRLLLGDAGDLAGKRLVIQADGTPRVDLLTLEPNPRCMARHERLEPLLHSPGASLGQLLAGASFALGAEPEQILFHNRTLVQGIACPSCGAKRDLVRFSHAVTDGEVRCTCGSATEMAPVELHDSLPAAEARRLGEARWDELGLPVADVVTGATRDREVHYVVNEAQSEVTP
jgi:adenylyltransferase/sulfurtransferase